MGLPADADLLAALEQAPGETLAQMQAGIEDTVNGLPESIVSQAAVAYVRAEYEALGLDVDGIQMRYLAVSGGKMLGLAFLGLWPPSRSPSCPPEWRQPWAMI